MSRVTIRMDSHGRGRLEIDGVEVKGITRVIFAAGVGRTNRVRLELIADQVDVVAEEAECVTARSATG